LLAASNLPQSLVIQAIKGNQVSLKFGRDIITYFLALSLAVERA